MEFTIKNFIFLLLLLLAGGFFGESIKRLISYLKIAKPENRWDNIPQRIIQTIKIAFFQTKILRDKEAGFIHAGIFWGFLTLIISAVNAVLSGLGIKNAFSFLGPLYAVISLAADFFCIAIIVAVVWAFYRRFVQKVKRLQLDDDHIEAAFILFMIFTIVISLLVENSSAISMGIDSEYAIRPVSYVLSFLYVPIFAEVMHELAFWMHIIFILLFLNFLPYSKHLHVLTSIPNVFLSNIGPVNSLNPINFEDETIEQYGAADVEDFSWKVLFDGYTCTHCGRCTSVCPANITGKVLDPREIIIQTRQRTVDKVPILLKMQEAERNHTTCNLTEKEQAIMAQSFVGDYQNIDALWQCTTCGACMQECPVNIEHVPAIVEMRRSLVLMSAEFPSLLASTFDNMETNSNPWAFSSSERADWTEGENIKIAEKYPKFDVLFWVGCAGSFDDRAKKVSVAFSKLMKEAGVDFAILGNEEQCTGDTARRAGNEYLADSMVKANIETLSKYRFSRIVATCPHCFNTLKNDFPLFGGNYEVIHHTQFLMELIKSGKLKLSKHSEDIELVTAYHDSCYIGRYNNIYKEPRNILNNISNITIAEPERNKDKGLCCGAGGGQMFMEETVGKRVNIERTEELVSSNPTQIAVNCPFCMTMISDGVKALDKDNIKVKDVSEILLESIERK